MYLEKIEIQGFKSFAEKTTVEFPRPAVAGSRGVACIVGPNGSGKSNIVDAIRWVLGEQSLKSLRGKQASDVIFAGSEKKTRLGMAQVSLYINNADGRMSVDYPEVVITRKMYRSGESDYFINKNKVRLQDVVMLAAESNFGQKSYSIVSQGSIDQVILSSPAARKDYFDEAVGVKPFQIKRDQSINKLELAWNNLRQVDALLSEIKPRLASLTRMVRRLEKREEVEKELRGLQQRYYGSQWYEFKSKVSVQQGQLSGATAELAKKDAAIKEVQQKLNALEKQDTRTEGFNILQKKYQQLVEQRAKLREEELMLRNKIELAKARQTEIVLPLPVAEIVKKLKHIAQLQQNISAHLDSASPTELKQAVADSKALRAAIDDLITRIENPQATVKQKAVEVDGALLKDLEEVTKELKEFDGKLATAQAEVQKFTAQEQEQKGAFFELQRAFQVRQSEYNTAASKVSEIRVELAKYETQLNDLERDVKEQLGDTHWLAAFKTSKEDLSDLHSQIAKLRHQIELIGGIDQEAIKEYGDIKERHDFLDTQAEDLRSSIKSLEKVITELDEKIQEQFDSSFKHINAEFSKFFKILFDGGKAEIQLIKEDQAAELSKAAVPSESGETETLEADFSILDQLTDAEKKLSPRAFLKKRAGKVVSGIEIAATPPGKKVLSISMLSGGERSLSSIALICAIIANNPPPFVILDEVDAALDEANSSRFAKIVEELAHKTQFIVITHNRATMHVANILYGVTMTDAGISHLLGLKMEEAEKIVRQ